MNLIYYRSDAVLGHNLPGLGLFRRYHRVYGFPVMPIDRTNSIKFPIKMKSLSPLPAMTAFDKSYEQLCDERARELLEQADRLDVPLSVFWSGGIDSTLVLAVLLKHATPAQRERIAVLLTDASISEYPEFYRRHIRGQLRCVPGTQFPHLFGTKNLLVTGGHNDQLFGSDLIATAIKDVDFDTVVAPYSRAFFTDFFANRMSDRAAAEWYIELFERLADRAPVKIRTNFDLFWWINFSLKWQHVNLRLLTSVAPSNRGNITAESISKYYAPFFATEFFQLWSLNNLDKRVRGSWRSYKWPAKDVIFDFTQDADYRASKLKLGSLQLLVKQQVRAAFIDDQYTFHEDVPPETFYEPDNDFTEPRRRWN